MRYEGKVEGTFGDGEGNEDGLRREEDGRASVMGGGVGPYRGVGASQMAPEGGDKRCLQDILGLVVHRCRIRLLSIRWGRRRSTGVRLGEQGEARHILTKKKISFSLWLEDHLVGKESDSGSFKERGKQDEAEMDKDVHILCDK